MCGQPTTVPGLLASDHLETLIRGPQSGNRFAKLPTELRLQIYRLVIESCMPNPFEPVDLLGGLGPEAEIRHALSPLALRLVNKQTSFEAAETLFKTWEFFFHITYWDQAQNALSWFQTIGDNNARNVRKIEFFIRFEDDDVCWSIKINAGLVKACGGAETVFEQAEFLNPPKHWDLDTRPEARRRTERALDEKLIQYLKPGSSGGLDAAGWVDIVLTIYHAKGMAEHEFDDIFQLLIGDDLFA